MTAQFQYARLAHQAQAVQAITSVFADVPFLAPPGPQANPTFSPYDAWRTLKANIEQVRASNQVNTGPVLVPTTATPALSLDVLMETGTGKTFTFIETIHALHQQHKLSKFIVLVPSNAIRQGTLKSLQTMADFFAKEYNNQKINVINYSEKTVGGFIHAANHGISVLVATYQSFNKDKNSINKRGVEANLFGRAKSYMEALAAIRPVIVIDEPHRFEGKQTQEYLARFNPLFTVRFGATFKNDEYCNLLYTLDSLEAFRQRLVKGITVDTVGTGAQGTQSLCLQQVTGTLKERVAHVAYEAPTGDNRTIELRAKDNLGDVTGLAFLNGHVVEQVTTKELLFTNGFSLPLGEPASYGMLADELQSHIIHCAIANHFEREEALFKRGIKALSLFFIDAVHKYLPDGQHPAVVRDCFERHYRAELDKTLARPDLHPPYRAYLERSRNDIAQVHKGYFARSNSEKGEEEAIKLILQEKERLLSFDTDLRFIFSMWALQEGWDNPNVFTLCKLAPSTAKITKLQQIGRGLRLAVNQQLQRVPPDDPAFDEINDLVVVVPASEGDFVRAIQSEITGRSVKPVGRVFDDKVLADYGVATSTRMANKVLDALASIDLIELDDDSGQATLLWQMHEYQARRGDILAALAAVKGLQPDNLNNMVRYLDSYFESAGQVKAKPDRRAPTLTVNPAQFQKFKELWQSLNRSAVLHYELDQPTLVQRVLERIERDFDIRALTINITRTEDAQSIHTARSTSGQYVLKAHTVYTLGEFLRALANGTRLSLHTVADIVHRMPADKFAQIKHNENRALSTLRDLILRCMHELLVNKVTYELREVRVKTALTDNTGQLLQTIPVAWCGKELHNISNPALQERSLYSAPAMPVDSEIERATVDESHITEVTVFAKLPKIDIPTPAGKYNPDFGYTLHRNGQTSALYLVVETKGYDNEADIPDREKWKIQSARRFFEALRQQGVPVHYQTKINGESLAQLIAHITPPATA